MKVGIDVKFSVDVRRGRLASSAAIVVVTFVSFCHPQLIWNFTTPNKNRNTTRPASSTYTLIHIACGILSVQRTWYNFRILFLEQEMNSLSLSLIQFTCSCLFTLSHLAGSFNTSFSSFRHILNQPYKYLVFCVCVCVLFGGCSWQQMSSKSLLLFLVYFSVLVKKEIDRYNYRFWWIFWLLLSLVTHLLMACLFTVFPKLINNFQNIHFSAHWNNVSVSAHTHTEAEVERHIYSIHTCACLPRILLCD